MIIKTPSGYAVTLKDQLTYGQFVEIQSIVTGSMKYSIAESKMRDVDSSVLMKANQKTLEFMVVEVELPDGTKSNNPIQAIMDMPVKDGQMVQDKVSELTQEASVSKKKGS
jgi:hypothetical protein